MSGRSYPVELRYRPLGAVEDGGTGAVDQVEGIRRAVDELRAEGPGDILVFLSGEREIRDTAAALGEAGLTDTDVLPLYARLSAAEQQGVPAPPRPADRARQRRGDAHRAPSPPRRRPGTARSPLQPACVPRSSGCRSSR